MVKIIIVIPVYLIVLSITTTAAAMMVAQMNSHMLQNQGEEREITVNDVQYHINTFKSFKPC